MHKKLLGGLGKNVKVMAYADPIVEAGKRISPFFIESVAVGSIVTIAVITAKNSWDVKKITN